MYSLCLQFGRDAQIILIIIQKFTKSDQVTLQIIYCLKLALTGKPILSAMSVYKLFHMVYLLGYLKYKNYGIIILQCVAMYGNPKESYANISVLDTLSKEFPDKLIGYSDHTIGSLACEVAVAKGARILEVHFTDDKSRVFRDHHIAMDANDIREIKKKIDLILNVNGNSLKVPVADGLKKN